MSESEQTWTIFLCPECGDIGTYDSVFDADDMQGHCVNYRDHPLNDERKEWPIMEKVTVARVAEGDA